MIDQQQISRLKTFLEEAKDLALVFPKESSEDLFLSTVVLFEFLEAVFHGEKQIDLLGSSDKIFLPEELKAISNFPQVKKSFSKDTLLIHLPYDAEKVEQVYSQISEDRADFFISIKAKIGVEPVSRERVKFSYTGNSADLLILMGMKDWQQLLPILGPKEQLTADLRLITFNNYLPDFGNLNLDISGTSSYAESIFYLMKHLAEGFEIDLATFLSEKNRSSLLLFGIEVETDRLSNKKAVSSTFLAVSELLQLGGKRLFSGKKSLKNSIRAVNSAKKTIQKKSSSQKIQKPLPSKV